MYTNQSHTQSRTASEVAQQPACERRVSDACDDVRQYKRPGRLAVAAEAVCYGRDTWKSETDSERTRSTGQTQTATKSTADMSRGWTSMAEAPNMSLRFARHSPHLPPPRGPPADPAPARLAAAVSSNPLRTMGAVSSCCESCCQSFAVAGSETILYSHACFRTVRSRKSQSYEPLLLENEREAVADLLQYLESMSRLRSRFC